MSDDSGKKLKIATWNLDRPKHASEPKSRRILAEIVKNKPDIWVFTETNSCIHPGPDYVPFSTSPLLGGSFSKGEQYEKGENRVTIWVNRRFQSEQVPELCNWHSSICVAIRGTPFGDLYVYGTVIGIYGLGGVDFDTGLEVQIDDWRRLSKLRNICIVGDFNVFLEESTSHSKKARGKLQSVFTQLDIEVPTQEVLHNVDHIALSKSLSKAVVAPVFKWNDGEDGKTPDRNISDHMGVCVTLTRSEQSFE
jgi:hypothetical protein